MNKYFPEDPKNLEYMLQIYAIDMKVKALWVQEAFDEYNRLVFSGKEFNILNAYRKATEIISHGMAIVRMFEKAGNVRPQIKEEKMLERIEMINNRWSLPDPPEKLRGIRNKLEHFEQLLDDWVTNSANHNVVDFHYGEPIYGMSNQDSFRRLDGHNFYFKNQIVNLKEINDWAKQLSDILQSS